MCVYNDEQLFHESPLSLDIQLKSCKRDKKKIKAHSYWIEYDRTSQVGKHLQVYLSWQNITSGKNNTQAVENIMKKKTKQSGDVPPQHEQTF